MTKDMIDLAAPKERAFLVAVDTGDDPGWTAEESISELANLADTGSVGAGASIAGADAEGTWGRGVTTGAWARTRCIGEA